MKTSKRRALAMITSLVLIAVMFAVVFKKEKEKAENEGAQKQY